MQIEKLYQELAGYSYTYTAHMHPALLQGWQRRLYPHCIGMHGMEMEPWRHGAASNSNLLTSPKLGTQPLSHVSCTHAWAWPAAADLVMRCDLQGRQRVQQRAGWLCVLRLLGRLALPSSSSACLPTAMHAASYCSAGTKVRLCAAQCTLHGPSPLWACG